MITDEIMQYYDDLMRLASAKCDSRADAEDLVGDTLLAAYAYLHRGGQITHPKTWLVNTLYHKYNDGLRKKYRMPTTVCLDVGLELAEEEDEDYHSSEEAAGVRRELNHLAYLSREVLIGFYYGNQRVADIAKRLNIPEGTVKSRLAAGRNQIKKGLETMKTKENHLPGQLFLSFGGSNGCHGEPISLVETDLIAQNLLILAYETPLTVSELSKAISIPAAYIEPILQKLIDGELMVRTESGKVYSDFMITKPQHVLANFKAQLTFAHQHFDAVWEPIQRMNEQISLLPAVQALGEEQRIRLERYAVLKALQDFQNFGGVQIEAPHFPKRKDGGRWLAQAMAFDAGYDARAYWESAEYMIHGGHRTSQAWQIGRAKRLRLYEFDTTLWDSPHRYGDAFDLYFKHVIPLLWHIYDGIPPETSEIPNEFLARLPMLETVGMIGQTEGKPYVKIPVLEASVYREICTLIRAATAELTATVGKRFAAFTATMKAPIPKHLTSVPTLYRYFTATNYFVMAIVREAYEKQLHLQGVQECCPPVVLVYELDPQ